VRATRPPARWHVSEQIDGELQSADAFELGDLGQQRLQPEPAGVGLQLGQQPRPARQRVARWRVGDERVQQGVRVDSDTNLITLDDE